MTDETLLKQGFKAQARSLREFGYPDVTAEMVEQAHKKWLTGEKATEIIAMFCERAFNEHPQIFGKPEKSA